MHCTGRRRPRCVGARRRLARRAAGAAHPRGLDRPRSRSGRLDGYASEEGASEELGRVGRTSSVAHIPVPVRAWVSSCWRSPRLAGRGCPGRETRVSECLRRSRAWSILVTGALGWSLVTCWLVAQSVPAHDAQRHLLAHGDHAPVEARWHASPHELAFPMGGMTVLVLWCPVAGALLAWLWRRVLAVRVFTLGTREPVLCVRPRAPDPFPNAPSLFASCCLRN
jgi:hypothetical protein